MFDYFKRRTERKAKEQKTKILALYEQDLSKVSGILDTGILTLDPEPIKAAIKIAKRLETPNVKDINDEIYRLENISSNLLPIESDSKEKLAKEIFKLKLNLIDTEFPRIDMSILNWRRKDGWPCFAFYATKEVGVCQLSLDSWDGPRITPSLKVNNVYPYYQDVFKKLTVMSNHPNRDDRRNGIQSTFQGCIPLEIRNIISKNESKFDDVFIIAEANWEQVAVPNLDPLVIGSKTNGYEAICWLIGAFDLTPIEQLIKAEWTTGPEISGIEKRESN
jgi:hypothetical protein